MGSTCDKLRSPDALVKRLAASSPSGHIPDRREERPVSAPLDTRHLFPGCAVAFRPAPGFIIHGGSFNRRAPLAPHLFL